jgi:hypothetical protein
MRTQTPSYTPPPQSVSSETGKRFGSQLSLNQRDSPAASTCARASSCGGNRAENAVEPGKAPGHDFGQMRVHSDEATPGREAKKLNATAASQAAESLDEVKGISQSGTGTVNIDYTPDASDKSSKIVFIQVMKEFLDGSPVKPSESNPAFAYQDADTTADFYHVDYVSGEADPYYNGDDAKDPGTQGNAISKPQVNAHMDDTPDKPDGRFPAGKTKFKEEFRTIAFSAAGADKGTYYAYAKWFYEKEKGSPGTTKLDGTSTDTALPKSKEAIKLFCSNHGFVLPTP